MHRHVAVAAILVLVAALLALAACQSIPVPVLVPASSETQFPRSPCDPCAKATQLAGLTQTSINDNARQAQASATADILMAQALATANAATATQSAALAEEEINAIALQAQAAATADILRAHALATFNAASSTQGAALTQDSLHTSALQADAAATANVLRAEALATFNSASSTQSSALTQAAVEQTQVKLHQQLTAQSATQSAAATGTQRWIGALVAGTATTLARVVANQTQSAAVVTQRAADQRQEQSRGPIVLLWKWGLPIFILAVALLCLWGLWRWLKIHTSRQNSVGQTVGGPLIILEQGRSLAEYLPNLLRWMAWFVETKSIMPAPDSPPHAAVVNDSPQNSAVAATTPAEMTRGPAPDQAIEVAQLHTAGANEVETEVPADRAKVRLI